MSFQKSIFISLFIILCAAAGPAQDRTTGGLKGKVKVASGSPNGISVVARLGEREVVSVTTDSKGSFALSGLAPGLYTLRFNKAGFSTGTLSNIEVKAGKVRELSDKLVLTVDEGTLAFLRGSVFDPIGRSVPGAKIELARIEADGTAKKLDGRLTNETGQFVFRLTPEAAKYRVTAKIEGAETVSKDVEIDGPAVYRIALSLKPVPK
ncbi:MAG: carboxypeptidase regulatory-like domain-containing protein [Acidobacteria bacterium]|nr:carboxypeptidase regulatory-like domain-containing protein [Acidobacteriota bacterium]